MVQASGEAMRASAPRGGGRAEHQDEIAAADPLLRRTYRERTINFTLRTGSFLAQTCHGSPASDAAEEFASGGDHEARAAETSAARTLRYFAAAAERAHDRP